MTLSSTTELVIQRMNTVRFINADPTTLVLQPVPQEEFVNGTKRLIPGGVRSPQKFKVIWDGSNGVNREPNELEGGSRRFDFVLVGSHDAEVAIGDYWKTGDQKFVVEYIFPSNGWEVKAGGVSHGTNPTG